jgi:hypothetical protein
MFRGNMPTAQRLRSSRWRSRWRGCTGIIHARPPAPLGHQPNRPLSDRVAKISLPYLRLVRPGPFPNPGGTGMPQQKRPRSFPRGLPAEPFHILIPRQSRRGVAEATRISGAWPISAISASRCQVIISISVIFARAAAATAAGAGSRAAASLRSSACRLPKTQKSPVFT